MATTEERLAALEKQMAQLTDTRPTTYYTHQYSGEEIDAAVGRALTGGALDTSVTNVRNQLGTFVRPNLLDNWYFGRPVNQRGQTEYTGNVYYIDRWRSWDGDSASLSVVSGGIKIAGTLYQYFEPAVFEELWGKTVAISLLLADGTLYTDYFALKRADWYTVPIKAHGLDSVQFGINNNNFGNENNNFFRVQPATIGTLSDTILAAKLELGPTQTLAHREGDRWVINEMPDYGEQLRRCQRYYQVLSSIYWAAKNDDGAYRLTIPIARMRTTPVANYDEKAGTGTVIMDTANFSDTSIQFYTTGTTNYIGIKNIRLSADL